MGTLVFGSITLLLAALLALFPRQTLTYKLALLVPLLAGTIALRSAGKEPAARAKAQLKDRYDVCNNMGDRVSDVIVDHKMLKTRSESRSRSFREHAIRVNSAAIGELFQTMKTVCLRPRDSCDALIDRLPSEEDPLSEAELHVLERAFRQQQGCEAAENIEQRPS